MLTKFGKEIRKFRIDKSMTLADMAEKIQISVAHLSAIETGRRNITSGSLNKILSIFTLDKHEKERLKRLSYESNKSIKIDLSNSSSQSRQLVTAFARKFNTLSKEDIKSIKQVLEKDE